MKTIIKQINESMPSYINTNDPDYLYIWGKEVFAPESTIDQSSDYNCGAFCNELEYLRGYIDSITKNVNLEYLEGSSLDSVINFLLGLNRLFEETDESFKRRAKSLLQRKGNLSWVSKKCILDVFSYYFSEDSIFVVENTITNDVILNGSFENVTGDVIDDWNLNVSSDSEIVSDIYSRIDGGRSVKFINGSSGNTNDISQTISCSVAGTYIFHLFFRDSRLKDTNAIEIFFQRTSDGYYFNKDTMQWQADFVNFLIKSFGDGKYHDAQAFFILSSSDDILVTLRSSEDSVSYTLNIDRVKCGLMQNYPSFYLYILSQISGLESQDFMNAWPGTTDPISGSPNYNYASYINQDYILGAIRMTQSFYQELLDTIKTCGVKGIIEIIQGEQIPELSTLVLDEGETPLNIDDDDDNRIIGVDA